MYRASSRETPWGPSQDVTRVADGIVSISTASHGGYHVSPERLLQMPDYLRNDTYAGKGWFEEDCDWALVCLAFPDLFSPYMRYCAVGMLRSSYSGFEKRRPLFEASEAGKALIAEVESFCKQYAHCFELGSGGSGSKPGRWWQSATSIDGKTRLDWEQESLRPYQQGFEPLPPLVSPFTKEEAQARAIPGAFKVSKGIPCQECGVYLFHEREMKYDCKKAIPLANGKPGNHTISVTDLLQWEDWQLCG